MTSKEFSSFDDIAAALRTAFDNLSSAGESGDASAITAAQSTLLAALTDATLASVEALGRFAPMTNPDFFEDEPRDIVPVLEAGLDLPAEMVISRELAEMVARIDDLHPHNPVQREFTKAVAPGAFALHAIEQLERELIALRKEVRGT
ncbi:hypothetical protein [Mycobacterium paraterrae]|uniref:Uncharacterized protein n=1 Tax=Mycobacterium paraterrae TaxID=577492 RepID=A0ABY3VE35_9MYCO|nr:hypothetical protein [Mycobacterium paraterrae]UMB67688.1 hypothetical protein MKK62_14350 [Mycobacterium paraterrae]